MTQTTHEEKFDEFKLEQEMDEDANIPEGRLREPDVKFTPEEEAKLYRQVDWRILPILALLYLSSFMDRGAIGNARLSCRLSAKEYATCLSVFFVTYFLFEVPSNLALTKIRPRFWLAFITFGWGIAMTLSGIVKTYAGLAVCRTILGAFEAGGLFPGVPLYLSFFYPRFIYQRRLAIFFSAATMAGAFAGLLAYYERALKHRQDNRPSTRPGMGPRRKDKLVATVRSGEGMTWAGYPVSIDGDLSFFWSSTLNRAKARLAAASARHVPPRARAMYANSYVTSKVIHLLSFDIPPITFVDAFEQALISFVWQSESFRPVTEKAVFLRRDLGGLGLLSIEDIVRSMAIRFWDCVAHGFEPIWADLARLSWRQTYPDETSIWSTLIASPRRARHARWTKVINLARQNLPHVFPELLQSNEVMVIPPTLPSLHPHGLSDEVRKQLKKYGAIIDLYRRPQTTGEPVHPRPQPDTPLGRLWAAVSARSPIAPLLPQPAPVRTIIVDSQFPRPCTYSFLGTTRPYTIKALRRFINENRYPSMDDADKKDVHWKWIFGATPTCVLQWHHGHATSDGCPHCGQRDTFMHFFFECEHSLEYWSLVLQLLRVSLGQADEFQSGTVDSPQIMLGLPRVRGGDRNSRTYIVVRVVLAIAFNKLYLARWHRHKDQIPLPTPYLLAREVHSHLKFRLRRLPDDELLEQLIKGDANWVDTVISSENEARDSWVQHALESIQLGLV
ncbi:BQ2448_5254 [Microbotryum intermedium]|uniref:BQ2448_5254 protein n=1 Tax=Microbotryum intermedium TaxID=269621 RepID=A0A238F6L0_9BASI|nr:BQ2448_5254 [Microbotryum intermedium]